MARDASSTGSDRRETARARLAGNPFYVLGLRPDCARAEVEREGQKLIGMLELELSSATTYRSPVGVHRRTPELVREAMAELRDPNRRLLHELWATLEPGEAPTEDPSDASERSEREQAPLAPFPALRALGFGDWGRR
jgi:hypothetical protein